MTTRCSDTATRYQISNHDYWLGAGPVIVTISCVSLIAGNPRSTSAPFRRGIQHMFTCPLDDEAVIQILLARRCIMKFCTLGPIDTLRFHGTDVLSMLLEGLIGIPAHPVWAPVTFEDLFVDEPHLLTVALTWCGWLNIRVVVDHFHLFVQR